MRRPVLGVSTSPARKSLVFAALLPVLTVLDVFTLPSLSVAPAELPEVFITPRRLAQVRLNLLVNAGDALEEARVARGEVRVWGEVRGERVVLGVDDNGPEGGARLRLELPIYRPDSRSGVESEG